MILFCCVKRVFYSELQGNIYSITASAPHEMTAEANASGNVLKLYITIIIVSVAGGRLGHVSTFTGVFESL